LARRLAAAGDRPLLEGAEREDVLTRLLAERRPFYRFSAHHISTAGQGPDEVADALLKLLTQP
jgi:shikimate kinase